MAHKSPKEYKSITEWIKQYITIKPIYTISITEPEHGTITCDHTEATEGTQIVCSVTTDPDYAFKALYVNGIESALEFTMPSENVVLSASIEWIIYGTLEAPTVEIVSNSSTELIYSIKNSNNVDVLFNGETVSALGALELTHVWESSETSFLVEGYFSADHYLNSPELIETIDKPKSYSKGLKYTKNSDGTSYSVVGIGTCTDTEVNIPPTYENLPVTSVSADSSCTEGTWGTNTTSITGESIKKFTYYAFNWSNFGKNLVKLDFPNAELIENRAFCNNWYITSVNLPKVTEINGQYNYGCFYYFSGLKELSLPSLTTVDSYVAFKYLNNLEKLDLGHINSCGVDSYFISETGKNSSSLDIYIHTTVAWTTKVTNSNWIYTSNNNITIHLNKNLDLNNARKLFGSYFDYNGYLSKRVNVVFDLEE